MKSQSKIFYNLKDGVSKEGNANNNNIIDHNIDPVSKDDLKASIVQKIF